MRLAQQKRFTRRTKSVERPARWRNRPSRSEPGPPVEVLFDSFATLALGPGRRRILKGTCFIALNHTNLICISNCIRKPTA